MNGTSTFALPRVARFDFSTQILRHMARQQVAWSSGNHA